MIRVLARHDVSRYGDVSRWPIREALNAYEDLIRRETTEQYRHEQLMFGLGKLAKPPRMPVLLARINASER